MEIHSRSTQLFLLMSAVLALLSTVARTQSPYQPGVEFPAIRLAPGERAQVSALNRGTGLSTMNARCSVTLQFLGARDRVVKQTVARLERGQTASLDIYSGELPGGASTAKIRTVVLFGYYGGAPPGPAVAAQFDCNLVPKLEVYVSGGERTRLSLTDARPLPFPATPVQ